MRRWTFILASTLLIVGPTAPGAIGAGDADKVHESPSQYVIHPFEEVFVGRGDVGPFKQRHPESEDDILKERVYRVGRQIAAHSDRAGFPYRFYVFRASTYIIQAYSGGDVVISEGAVNAYETDDELAFALGHELAHVALRHLVEDARASKIADFDKKDKKNGEPAVPLAKILWNKDHEYEADLFGAVYAARAGFRFSASIDVLRDLDRRGLGGAGIETHPLIAERVQKLEQSQDKLTRLVGLFRRGVAALELGETDTAIAALTPFVTEFPRDLAGRVNLGAAHLDRSRRTWGSPANLAESLPLLFDTAIRIREGQPSSADSDLDNAMAHFEQALQIAPGSPHALAGRALVDLRLDELDRARSRLDAAIRAEPGRADFRLCLGNVEFVAGDFPLARQRYEDALDLRPGWTAAVYNLARVAMKTADSAQQRFLWGALLEDPRYGEEARTRLEQLELSADTVAR